MKNTRGIIILILLVIIVLAVNTTVIISQHNKIKAFSAIPEEFYALRTENILLKEGFFHTYDYEGAAVDYSIPVFDLSGNAVYLNDILRGKNWIAMYISAGQGGCASCIADNMEFIKRLQKDKVNFFVCVEGLEDREFRIFTEQYDIEDNAYSIYDFAFPKKGLSPVVLFVVDSELNCRYFYAPSPWFPDLTYDYYEIVRTALSLK